MASFGGAARAARGAGFLLLLTCLACGGSSAPTDAGADAPGPAADAAGGDTLAPATDAAPVDTGPADTAGCSGVGTGASLGACDNCLDTACTAQLCACDDACLAIEACLHTVCRHLTDSEMASCQVYCQNLHLAAKPQHLAVVSCAYQAQCAACDGWPAAYTACRTARLGGACASARAACDGSADCLAYESCVGGCTTATGCAACSSTTGGAAGRALLTAVEACVAHECFAAWWAR